LRKQTLVFTVTSLIVAGLAVALNLVAFPRDMALTRGISSFASSEVVGQKLWNESPVQLLYTFMGGGIILNPGTPGDGGFIFADRLLLKYGEDRVGLENPIVDLRGSNNSEEIASFRDILRDTGYESVTPCPHDYQQTCTVYFTWNRDRTKEQDIVMVSIRVGEFEYAMVDDSLVQVGGTP